MPSAQFEAETTQLRCDLTFAESENSRDNAFDSVGALWNERPIQDPTGVRPKIDSGRDEVQDFVNF